MTKTIVRDVFGELLETGKTAAKFPPLPAGQPRTARSDSGLDWLEKMAPQQTPAGLTQSQLEEEKRRKEQIERLRNIDKRRSQQAYEEIQKQIQLYRRQKTLQPRQYVTAQPGYDKEQHENPESFWDKVKKKKEAIQKKLLPWTARQTIGTGEITRGVSG